MSYKVRTIDVFEHQVKKLIKKYASLKNELSDLIDILEQNPNTGIPLGKNCYKIRIGISSKGKGKSGGARIITTIVVAKEAVYLLSIYDKTEKENLTDEELSNLLKNLPQ